MKKGTRITLTKAEAESSTGKHLIEFILAMCHDGELDIREIDELHKFLRNDQSGIAAVSFLRGMTRDAVADGAIDGPEAYRLKGAFQRVVPKEVRGVVSTHLEGLGTPTWADLDQEPAWTRHEATSKQIDYLVALGGSVKPGMTKGEASQLIDQLLERRPPTPRQQMLLRFFNRLDLATSTKEQVSSWIDNIFCLNPDHEAAWERFKRETNHDPFGQDPSIVPVGACGMYLATRRRKRVGHRPSGAARLWMMVWRVRKFKWRT